jgi:hypothetical protein
MECFAQAGTAVGAPGSALSGSVILANRSLNGRIIPDLDRRVFQRVVLWP